MTEQMENTELRERVAPELRVRGEILRKARRNLGLTIAYGVVLIALGAFSISTPYVASGAVVIALGLLLLGAGVVQALHAIASATELGLAVRVAVAVLHAFAGMTLLAFQTESLLVLTSIIAAFLVLAGIARIVNALRLRHTENWGWLLAGGILSAVLGGLIAAQLPQSALWVIGLFVGIDLVFAGTTTVAVASAARRVLPRPS